MKKKILKLNCDDWFADRPVRLCSPAARGFLIDLRMLCVPSGYLVLNGLPLSDDQIASLTGSTVAKVREWLKELAAANAYDVDNNGLYFVDMVKEAVFKAGAKVSGARGAAKKKEVKVVAPVADPFLAGIVAKGNQAPAEPTTPVKTARPAAPTKKPAAWWKTPNGWVAKGREQAISMKPGEDLVAFQERVARRLPDGDWLDVLPARVAKAIRADIQEHAAKPK